MQLDKCKTFNALQFRNGIDIPPFLKLDKEQRELLDDGVHLEAFFCALLRAVRLRAQSHENKSINWTTNRTISLYPSWVAATSIPPARITFAVEQNQQGKHSRQHPQHQVLVGSIAAKHITGMFPAESAPRSKRCGESLLSDTPFSSTARTELQTAVDQRSRQSSIFFHTVRQGPCAHSTKSSLC